MRTLFHHPLCPFSRKVRLVLSEGQFEHDLFLEAFWKSREEFLDLNPLGEVPVLCMDGKSHTQSQAIAEYLSAHPDYKGPRLIPTESHGDAPKAYQVRQNCAIADDYLYKSVVRKVVYEKYFKRQMGLGGPDSRIIRSGLNALGKILELLTWTLERQEFTAGDTLTLADFAYAAQFSCVDYFGLMNWDPFPEIKEWYARLKSRPSFAPLLLDKVAGIVIAPHYRDLDF